MVQKNNHTEMSFTFSCLVILDTKAAVINNRPKIYWRSDNELIKDKKITTENDYGVKVCRALTLGYLEYTRKVRRFEQGLLLLTGI